MRGIGSGIKKKGDEGQKRQGAWAKRTEMLRRTKDWPKQISHPSPENPPLISVSNRKIPDFGPGSTVQSWLHPTCKPCQERWHLADLAPHEGGWWLSLDLASCLKTEDGTNKEDHWGGMLVSLGKPRINLCCQKGRHSLLAAGWQPRG